MSTVNLPDDHDKDYDPFKYIAHDSIVNFFLIRKLQSRRLANCPNWVIRLELTILCITGLVPSGLLTNTDVGALFITAERS